MHGLGSRLSEGLYWDTSGVNSLVRGSHNCKLKDSTICRSKPVHPGSGSSVQFLHCSKIHLER